MRLDDDLQGSYEEGQENLVDHAKRDRRWCQGNLQHVRLLNAPGLKPWSRFVFFQGIMAYISPLFWIGFMLASIAAGMAFIAAFLNAVFGLCLGCQLYLLLQRVGLSGRPA